MKWDYQCKKMEGNCTCEVTRRYKTVIAGKEKEEGEGEGWKRRWKRERRKEVKYGMQKPKSKVPVLRVRHCQNESQSFIEVVSPTRFRHCRERWLTGNVRLLLIPLISLRVHPRYARARARARPPLPPQETGAICWRVIDASRDSETENSIFPPPIGSILRNKSELFLNCGEWAPLRTRYSLWKRPRIGLRNIQYSIRRRSSVTRHISFLITRAFVELLGYKWAAAPIFFENGFSAICPAFSRDIINRRRWPPPRLRKARKLARAWN